MNLSIVIINYNTKALLLDCLDSINKNTKNLSYEIIIVDNASTDGSVEILKRLKNRELKIILNRKNLGFAKANNQGIEIAKGRYILLLNSDTQIPMEVLEKMTGFMDKNPKVAVASCALKNKDGSLQATGGYFPTLPRVITWMLFLDDIPLMDKLIKPFHPMHEKSFIYRGEAFFQKMGERDWVTGAFFLVRREVFEEIGLLDEEYFMYTEEVDFCFRAKKKGWKVWYIPSLAITHFGGASSASEFPIISEYKGIKIFYRKHMPAWQMPVLRFLLKTGAVLRIFLLGVLKGGSYARAYAKAFQIA
jgi:GT2 family glycosyltransferase